MMTPFYLEAGGHRLNLTLAKNLQVMISYKLFSHSETQGPMIRQILDLFDMMTPYLTFKI